MSAPSAPYWKWLAVLSLAANAGLAVLWLRPQSVPEVKPVRPDLLPYAALGSFVAENNHVADLQWTSDQLEAFQRGIAAVYDKNGYKMDADAARLRAAIEAKVQTLGGGASDPVEAYFAEVRAKEGVLRAPSGLHYRVIDEGFGEPPAPGATVLVSLAARLPDGTKLPQLSQVRLRTTLTDLLPGLGEGAQMLRPGGKALLYLPGSLSFGEGRWPDFLAPGTPVIFLFELHEILP